MKIIFSPTKSQNSTPSTNTTQTPIFLEKTKRLLKILESYSLSDIKKFYKISDTLAEKTYHQYQSFTKQPMYPTIDLFTGTTFKQLERAQYNKKQVRYMNDHLVILSALYGCLEPIMAVYPYRLDMNDNVLKNSLDHKNLYDYWADEVRDYFKNEKVIISLASKEYASLIQENLYDRILSIHFVISSNGFEKTSAMDVKKQRGKLLNYMIMHQISDQQELQKYQSDGYIYDLKKSDTQNMYFIKHI